MRTVRVLLLLAINAVLVWGMAEPVSQAQPANRAGIVVQFGDGSVRTACVDLGEDGEATGDEVLTDAGFDVIMEASSVGAAVCKIGDDGCDYPGESCFCECEDLGSGDCIYWAYYHLIDGEWQYSNRGVTSYTVESGDVEGWAWGPGTVGAGGVKPPVRNFADVCAAPTSTATASATATATASPTRTPEPTPSDTPAPTATHTPTETPAPTTTATAIPTATAVPSASPEPSQTPAPTVSAPQTATVAPPSPTRQRTETNTPVPTNTTVTQTETPATSPTPLASPTSDATQPALATVALHTVTPLPTRWTRPTATSISRELALANAESERRDSPAETKDTNDMGQYVGFGVLVLMLLAGLILLQRGVL